MATSKNPYLEWEKGRQNSDYRCTDTQVTSLVRQQLSQSEYLRTSNRVNAGPFRRLRAEVADSVNQKPHVFGSEDMWGWQSWTQVWYGYASGSELAEGLIEQTPLIPAPGANYFPYGEVGGATYTEMYLIPAESPSFSFKV